MGSVSEKTHKKNVSNLEDLISKCVGYGTAYNPSNAAIAIVALNILLTNGTNENLAVIVAETAFKIAIKDRIIAFKGLKKLCTKIVNGLESSGASKEVVDNAKSINNKIQGKRVVAKVTPPPDSTVPLHKYISVSQQSFDSLINNFLKLIQLVSSEPLYAPNENPLKVASLNTYYNDLVAKNTAVINANTPYCNALVLRNRVLYKPDTGLVDIALATKKYVKSIFGATNPNYKLISGIKFTRPRKK